MSNRLGERQFTFAAITDTHINYGETETNSEFDINVRANGRMRHVIHDLNRQDLAFVIHLGDLVHPVPAVPNLYEKAAACFKEQIAELRHPIYLVPGNHDIGDKPIFWGPGGSTCDAYIELWQRTFGANFQCFDHEDCRFFIIDIQIVNSGLDAEAEQKVWLEAEMVAAAAAGKRNFLNFHYPLFLTNPEEAEHFDNIAEPGRSWLLDLMERYGAEASFAGHVHNYWYNRHAGTDHYALPSTAFVRQDYAEMYRAAPPPETEGGRSDFAKLGYFVVHVHEHGHICKWVRTFGAVAEPGSDVRSSSDRVAALHCLENPNTRFGFDMRQNWLEVIEIPPSGSLDEFERKRVRNDYALMALLEMGVRRVRIPARDLWNPERRRRLEDCAWQGIQITLFSLGIPDCRLLAAVAASDGLIDSWEIADVFDGLPAVVEAAAGPARSAGIDLYLTKVRSKEDIQTSGETYYHIISHGFTKHDGRQIAEIAGLQGVNGIVFRVDGMSSPWQAARDAAAACRGKGLKASLHVRMTNGKPGDNQTDDDWVAERIAQSLAVAAAYDDMHVFSDTYADVDRGYFRRHGVVTRFYNPRPAYHVLGHMNAVLAAVAGNNDSYKFEPGDDVAAVTLIGPANHHLELVSSTCQLLGDAAPSPGWLIDLYTGERVAAERSAAGDFNPSPTSPLCLWMVGGEAAR